MSTNRLTGESPDSTQIIQLATCREAMAHVLRDDRPADVAALAQVVLKWMPRHLDTYQWLLEAAWQLKQWDEGEEWGRRLLQADPNNAPAWRAVARGVEERGQRAQSHAVWQRAFEVAPFDPDVRSGLSRTNLELNSELSLNQACLATIYRHGFRWRHAATEYRALIEADPRRIDFLVGLMVSLWRMGSRDDAYQIALYLVNQHRHLIIAWVVIAAAGDENDRALAHDPIMSMDPDGEFSRQWLRLANAPSAEQTVARLLPKGAVPIEITAQEANLIDDKPIEIGHR
jgi:tetratricopeptide (TPR) repeat protein